MPTTIEALLECARAYVRDNLPGRTAVALRIALDDGSKVAHPIPLASSQAAQPPPKLNQMEQDVLEAMGEEELTGPQIAEKSGYPLEQSLRSCLASLRRRGILTGEKGAPGYRIAPGYRVAP